MKEPLPRHLSLRRARSRHRELERHTAKRLEEHQIERVDARAKRDLSRLLRRVVLAIVIDHQLIVDAQLATVVAREKERVEPALRHAHVSAQVHAKLLGYFVAA